MHGIPDLPSEIRRVALSVHGNRVLNGGFDKFVLAVGRDCNRAFHFTWKFAAVYVLARHVEPPGTRHKPRLRRIVLLSRLLVIRFAYAKKMCRHVIAYK